MTVASDATLSHMSREVSVRELRNRTAEVVKRVEAGETLSLTVNRRPVADIVPHDQRPKWVPWAVVRSIAEETPADRGLLAELDDALDDTIGDL